MTNVINKPVNVNAFYFRGSDLKTFPRQIELDDGEAVTFASGLRYLVRQGARAVRLFDMSTSENGPTYRLRQDGDQWTLIATKGVF